MTGVQALFNPIEEQELRDALDRAYAFRGARRRIASTLNSLPWVESAWMRGVLTRRIDSLRLRDDGHQRPALPFGWSAERDWDTDSWTVGPSWYILPRQWYREIRQRIYRFALKRGALKAPYEGCYFHEMEWWPRNPA